MEDAPDGLQYVYALGELEPGETITASIVPKIIEKLRERTKNYEAVVATLDT
jgi:anti-sigma factor ChrR (cupin superfamily)